MCVTPHVPFRPEHHHRQWRTGKTAGNRDPRGGPARSYRKHDLEQRWRTPSSRRRSSIRTNSEAKLRSTPRQDRRRKAVYSAAPAAKGEAEGGRSIACIHASSVSIGSSNSCRSAAWARVYLALDPETQCSKSLSNSSTQGPDPDRQEIAEAERRGAMLQARLCGVDQRIARIRGYGEHDGFFFIEMEYVEGRISPNFCERGPLGIPFAARIGRDLCEVLHLRTRFQPRSTAMQYHGIVHGDIKPRNIRITPDGQVKVLDFGIAKALSLTRKFTTNQFGSSQYSSPERLNTGDVDIACDLWSVGVVLYEIVTGKPYFQGENRRPSSSMRSATTRPCGRYRNHLPEPFRGDSS